MCIQGKRSGPCVKVIQWTATKIIRHEQNGKHDTPNIKSLGLKTKVYWN